MQCQIVQLQRWIFIYTFSNPNTPDHFAIGTTENYVLKQFKCYDSVKKKIIVDYFAQTAPIFHFAPISIFIRFLVFFIHRRIQHNKMLTIAYVMPLSVIMVSILKCLPICFNYLFADCFIITTILAPTSSRLIQNIRSVLKYLFITCKQWHFWEFSG